MPTSALHTLLDNVELAMQREIKGFICACIAESDKPKDKRKQARMAIMDQSQDIEQGIFSLGITTLGGGGMGGSMGAEGWKKSRANIAELPPEQFVSNVLFPRTNVDPEVRHALTFRRSIARWTHEVNEGRKELAVCSGEDTPSHHAEEDGALVYMDNIIQRTLLPEMQDEAVNAVIHFLERHDAFDPIVNDAFTRYPHHAVQVEAEMSVACQALYTSARPIFMALHRLPKVISFGSSYSVHICFFYLHCFCLSFSCEGRGYVPFVGDDAGTCNANFHIKDEAACWRGVPGQGSVLIAGRPTG